MRCCDGFQVFSVKSLKYILPTVTLAAQMTGKPANLIWTAVFPVR